MTPELRRHAEQKALESRAAQGLGPYITEVSTLNVVVSVLLHDEGAPQGAPDSISTAATSRHKRRSVSA